MFSNESLVMLGNESMENQSEAFGEEEMICPEISDDQSILLTDFAYWMEGVILLSIGCPGILGMCIAQLGYRGCHASMQGTPFENAQRWMGKNTFHFLLLNDDNMIGEH